MMEFKDKNSMLYWYPKLASTPGLVMPMTEIVNVYDGASGPGPIHALTCGDLANGDFTALGSRWDDILAKAGAIGYPVFIRTDHVSGKHGWKDTCFIEAERDLRPNLAKLFETSAMTGFLGLSVSAVVVREYVPMATLFTAFAGDMPVNPEYRYFIKDGKILCRHWYWIEDAIADGTDETKLPRSWRHILANARDSTSDRDFKAMDDMACKVAARFKGCWSVDFCKAADGRWILIDMARGVDSWHPKDCRYDVVIKQELDV